MVSTSPAIAITGARSLRASISPLKRWTTPGPGCSANRDGYTGEVSICDSGEYAVFFISHMHKVHISISAQRIDHRIQGVTDNAITAFYAGIDKHFPQQISHLSGHSDLYLLSRKNECKANSPLRVE
jgi:hypothetical protein